MKYQVNMFYSLQVEAESKEQAKEKASEYIASEEGQGVRLSDMSIEVEFIGVPCENCGGKRDVEALICSGCKPIGDHIHEWGEEKETESGEKIKWCKGCEATIDSDGGIIE